MGTMIQYTQDIAPYGDGNCWQTAVESILEVLRGSLPPQIEIAQRRGHSSYGPALGVYLCKHHGLAYVECAPGAVDPPRWHVMGGSSVRTPLHGRAHGVVGSRGGVAWDPHPSRAGLVQVVSWGILWPLTPEEARVRRVLLGALCECQACGGILR